MAITFAPLGDGAISSRSSYESGANLSRPDLMRPGPLVLDNVRSQGNGTGASEVMADFS